MPVKLCLIRDVAEIERLELSKSHLIFCDIPDVNVALRQKNFKVISSSSFTCRPFWEEVIELRNELLASIDFRLFREKVGFEFEFLDSLKFPVRMLLDCFAYELLIVKKIRKEFSIDEVVFGDGFIFSETYDPVFEVGPFDDVIDKWQQEKSRLIVRSIKRVFFEVSLLFLRLHYNKSFLALSSGSGLASMVDRVLPQSDKQDVTFLLSGRQRLTSISGVFHWICALCSNKKRFAGVVLPASRRWLGPFRPNEFIREKVIFRALKVKRADKVLGKKIAIQSQLLVLALFQNLSRWLGNHHRDLFVAKRVFDTIQPKLFIAQHSLNLSSCLAMEARKRGIGSLLVSHGSHIYSEDKVALKEWRHHSRTMFCGPFGATAIQTPAAAVFHEWLDTKPDGVITGPLIVHGSMSDTIGRDRQKLFGKNADKIILLHASTPKTPDSMRPLIYESLDEYVSNIAALVSAASENPDIHVAIRFRSVPGLSASSVKQVISNFDNWTWCETGEFEDWLACSDILVSYSSTTIEQAFFSKKPVMLFDRAQRYEHFSGPSVDLPNADLAGVCFCGENDLDVGIKQLLSEQASEEEILVQSIYGAFEESFAGSKQGLDQFLSGYVND